MRSGWTLAVLESPEFGRALRSVRYLAPVDEPGRILVRLPE
jgi:hypothetical protein